MKLFVKIARLENLFSKRKLPHFRGNEAMLEPSKSCIMEKDLKDHLSPPLVLHLLSYLITFFFLLILRVVYSYPTPQWSKIVRNVSLTKLSSLLEELS